MSEEAGKAGEPRKKGNVTQPDYSQSSKEMSLHKMRQTSCIILWAPSGLAAHVRYRMLILAFDEREADM